ncbi:MAG: PAS domain-containing protein [Rhodobacteraceae bacterium]|nr:PAS domain-containing protein [Paracoccaceae bacterium]
MNFQLRGAVERTDPSNKGGLRGNTLQTAARLQPGAAWLLPVAAALFGAAMMAPQRWISLGGLAGGAALTMLALLLMILARQRSLILGDQDATILTLIAEEADPVFATDARGAIRVQNRAALRRFRAENGGALVAALDAHVAAPEAMLRRLLETAASKGSAQEDVLLRRGHLGIAVTRVDPEAFLWRVVEQADTVRSSRGSDAISLPMLTVSRSGTVLFMNEALKRLIGSRQAALDRIVNDLPIRPGGVHEVAGTEGPLQATVVELGVGARRELYFVPLTRDEPVDDGQFLDALPVPLLKIDASGAVRHANRQACDLLAVNMGVDAKDPEAGMPLKSLVEGLGRPVEDWLADAAKGRGLGRPEVVRATRPEHETYLQISLGRVAAGDGLSLVAVLHDATELKTLEAQFVQSQKMQAIGQLAGGIAHDFNNLLTPISGHCDLLLLRHDAGDPEYADLIQITENSNRAASLVGQLLAFSRKQNMTPQQLDLRDTLTDLTHLLNRLVGETVSLTQTF